jgi:hypothetical protein
MVNYITICITCQPFDSLASNEESGGGGMRCIHVGGCWDGRSQEEGNKRPMIHELGS